MIEQLLIVLATTAGVGAHILKKVVQQRESDRTFSLKKYLTENPYKVALTFFYGAAGVAGLYVSDSASVYSALVTGFAANSLSGASDK